MIDHDNLEEFQDPANYDLEEEPGSEPRIAFYRGLAARFGGPILELACGTGIVALPILADGHDLVGLDLARPMLEHAHQKAQSRGLSAEWVAGDVRDFALGRGFGLIFMTGNAFQAMLALEDQRRLLACVRRHLDPGGVFAFDTRNPSGHDLSDIPEEEPWKSYRSAEGREVALSTTQAYDPAARVLHWTVHRRWEEGGAPRHRASRIACRFTPPDELDALLHEAGFSILERCGDYDGSPVTPASGELITLAGLRQA